MAHVFDKPIEKLFACLRFEGKIISMVEDVCLFACLKARLPAWLKIRLLARLISLTHAQAAPLSHQCNCTACGRSLT